LNTQRPNDPEILGYLVKIYDESGQFDKALVNLDGWLALHPEDNSAVTMRNNMRHKMTPAQQARYDSLAGRK
jgi:hypothetical protein